MDASSTASNRTADSAMKPGRLRIALYAKTAAGGWLRIQKRLTRVAVMLDPKPYLFGQHESLFCIDCKVREVGVYPYLTESRAGCVYDSETFCLSCGGGNGWFSRYKYRYK